MSHAKITTGNNDRPRDATISSTGPGLPDDTSRPPQVSDEDAARMEAALKRTGGTPRDKLEDELRDEIELPLKGSA
jgi:hypothetical protein